MVRGGRYVGLRRVAGETKQDRRDVGIAHVKKKRGVAVTRASNSVARWRSLSNRGRVSARIRCEIFQKQPPPPQGENSLSKHVRVTVGSRCSRGRARARANHILV